MNTEHTPLTKHSYRLTVLEGLRKLFGHFEHPLDDTETAVAFNALHEPEYASIAFPRGIPARKADGSMDTMSLKAFSIQATDNRLTDDYPEDGIGYLACFCKSKRGDPAFSIRICDIIDAVDARIAEETLAVDILCGRAEEFKANATGWTGLLDRFEKSGLNSARHKRVRADAVRVLDKQLAAVLGHGSAEPDFLSVPDKGFVANYAEGDLVDAIALTEQRPYIGDVNLLMLTFDVSGWTTEMKSGDEGESGFHARTMQIQHIRGEKFEPSWTVWFRNAGHQATLNDGPVFDSIVRFFKALSHRGVDVPLK